MAGSGNGSVPTTAWLPPPAICMQRCRSEALPLRVVSRRARTCRARARGRAGGSALGRGRQRRAVDVHVQAQQRRRLRATLGVGVGVGGMGHAPLALERGEGQHAGVVNAQPELGDKVRLPRRTRRKILKAL